MNPYIETITAQGFDPEESISTTAKLLGEMSYSRDTVIKLINQIVKVTDLPSSSKHVHLIYSYLVQNIITTRKDANVKITELLIKSLNQADKLLQQHPFLNYIETAEGGNNVSNGRTKQEQCQTIYYENACEEISRKQMIQLFIDNIEDLKSTTASSMYSLIKKQYDKEKGKY